MENINIVLEKFLQLVKESVSGPQVQFSVDYKENLILVISAPSGFLRDLYQNDSFVAHLRPEGLKLQAFKR